MTTPLAQRSADNLTKTQMCPLDFAGTSALSMGLTLLAAKNRASACSGLEMGVRMLCYHEYILVTKHESAYFSALGALFTQDNQ